MKYSFIILVYLLIQSCTADLTKNAYKVNLIKAKGLNWDVNLDSSIYGIPINEIYALISGRYTKTLNFYNTDFKDFKLLLDFESKAMYDKSDLKSSVIYTFLKPYPANKIIDSTIIDLKNRKKYIIYHLQDTVSLKFSYLGEYNNLIENWSVYFRLQNSTIADERKSCKQLIHFLGNIHIVKLDSIYPEYQY